MSLEKLAEKYRVKAIYRIIKEGKIVLGILAESDIDAKELVSSFGADEAIKIDVNDPNTRFPLLNGVLIVSLDDEYRKNIETTILEKIAEMKMEKLMDEDALNEIL